MLSMKNWKKVLGSIAVVLLLGTFLTACGNKQSTKSEYKYGTITIPAKNGTICGAPNYIAYEKGFFKKNGLKAKLVAKPTNISDLEAGFTSGKYDALNGDFQYLPAIQNGAQIQAAGGIHQGCISVLVPNNSPIKSVSDLKGKTIATPGQGSTAQYVASIALQHAGINPKTGVQWKTYDYDLLTKAAQKGQVDAIGTVDPYTYQAKKEDGFRTIIDNNNSKGNQEMDKMGMKSNSSCCYLYLSDKLTKKDSAKADAIVKSYAEAARWINQHPRQTAKILLEKNYVAKSKLVNEDNVTQLIKQYHFGLKKSSGKSDVTYYAKELKKAGFLKSNTNVKDLVDQAYYTSNNK